jgi:hypothetical protein
MNTELRMRELTVRAMIVLVWFEVLWAAVFFVGIVLQWSGLTKQLSIAFFGSGFCAALLLAALALLNVAVNLNIISKVQSRQIRESVEVTERKSTIGKMPMIAGGLIIVVIASIGFAEWKLYRSKMVEVESKLESIADSKLLGTAVDVVKSDGKVKELVEVRDGLSTAILSSGSLSLLYPRMVGTITVYYELAPWWSGGKDENVNLSESTITKFVPSSEEREDFEKLRNGKISKFVSASGDTVRAFRRVNVNGAHLILLIDTSRRSDYSRSGF